jgi:hypothetical protein
MTKGILGLACAGALIASGALAADERGGGAYPGASQHGTTGSQGAAGAAQERATGAMAGMRGMHEMTGTVTQIDKDEGSLSLESQGKEMELHFPPTALQNIDKGDQVTVQLAIRPRGTGTTGSERGTTGGGGPTGGESGGTRGGGTGTGTR